MKKYIDAEKLITKIEKSKNELKSLMSKLYYAANYKECKAELNGYNKILSIVSSLQQEQPEVDIEKKIEEHAENMPHGEFTHDSECVEHEEWAKSEFRHFYELGLNARKEE